MSLEGGNPGAMAACLTMLYEWSNILMFRCTRYICHVVSPFGIHHKLVMSELTILPSHVIDKKVDKRFSHVMWFNR